MSKKSKKKSQSVKKVEIRKISFSRTLTSSCGIIVKSFGEGEIVNGFMKPIEQPINFVLEGAKASYQSEGEEKDLSLKKTKKGYRVV